jgi:lipoprotein-anchoring transpeptidase ErfK/SrfK
MLRLKVFCAALGAGFMMLAAGAPARAQGLTQYGMWGDKPPERSGPSYLGAVPPMAKSVGLATGGARPNISPAAPQTISFRNGFPNGSIVIDTAGRKLYYTLSATSAYVYPVAVGKQGFAWTGVERVSRIEDWPDWIPPKEMRARKPSLPVRMTGGINNPLGAKAIYLGNTLYRIHGTNDSDSIGSAASSGCFRMHNEHVVQLAQHVNASTLVFVMKRLPKSGIAMPPSGYQPTAKAPAAQEPGVETQSPPAEPQAPEAAPQPGDTAPAQPTDQGI